MIVYRDLCISQERLNKLGEERGYYLPDFNSHFIVDTLKRLKELEEIIEQLQKEK